MKTNSQTEHPHKRIIYFLAIAFFVTLTAAKIFLASRLSLFGDDEAFYWQCSQHLSLAYSDHPFMTAFLILCGTKLLGNTYLGVRLLFLIMGSFIPFLIFVMARSLVGHRDALYAAAMSLAVPLLGGMGLLAMPDVPLIFFWILSLTAFERAVHSESIWPWILLGVSVAAGLNTHYRFVVFVVSALVYLAVSQTGRCQWKRTGLWAAVLIAGAGLLPVVWFNVMHDFAPLRFQFVSRHPGMFQPMALLQPLQQAAFVTPVLYVFLIMILVQALQRSANGDDTSTLLASFSVVPLAGYFILGLWADQKHTNFHWPLVGYVPLLILIPGLIRRFIDMPAGKWRRKATYAIAALAPVLGILGTLVLLGYFSMAVWPQSFDAVFTRFKRTAPYDFVGWREAANRTKSILQRATKTPGPVLVTDSFSLASELSFELGISDPIYVLDHARNYRYGRAYQYRIWKTDQAELIRKQRGRDALVIMEETNYKHLYPLCSMFESIDGLDVFYLFEGAKQFLFLYGHGLKAEDDWVHSSRCDLPSAFFLDSPKDNATISGSVVISGWAFKNMGGIQRIEVLVDGKPAGVARYGIERPDVANAYPDASDPNYPHVGFHFVWDTRNVTAGRHDITVHLFPVIGNDRIAAERRVYVRPHVR